MLPGKISPSLMCADILKIKEYLAAFSAGGIEYLHIDIMDGVFVPNFALGTDFCAAIRRISDIPLDVHLMVDRPENKIRWFGVRPGDIVSVHAESTRRLREALRAVKEHGASAFAAINPGTSVEALAGVVRLLDGVLVMTVQPGFAGQKMAPGSIEKISEVRAWLNMNGREDALLEVDGNVSFENAVKMRAAGADIFVSGSSGVFAKTLPLAAAIEKFRAAIL